VNNKSRLLTCSVIQWLVLQVLQCNNCFTRCWLLSVQWQTESSQNISTMYNVKFTIDIVCCIFYRLQHIWLQPTFFVNNCSSASRFSVKFLSSTVVCSWLHFSWKSFSILIRADVSFSKAALCWSSCAEVWQSSLNCDQLWINVH